MALQFDRSWEEKAEAASKNGDKLCYVGLIDMESRSCRAVLKVGQTSSHLQCLEAEQKACLCISKAGTT